MWKIVSLFIGLTLGAAVGAALVALLVPGSREQIIADLKRGYTETLEAARQASAQSRAELEAELAAIRQRRSASRAS